MQFLHHLDKLEITHPVVLAVPQSSQVVLHSGTVKLTVVVLTIAGSCEDDSMLAKDDAVHLFDVEFGLGEGEGVGDIAYVFAVDEDLLVSSYFLGL